MIVSLEAVPRDREALIAAAETVAQYPRIGLINIPDLLRFPLRSWEACGILRETTAAAGELMPHIRAIDFDMAVPFPHIEYLRSQGIKKVLVIAGDPPKEKKTPTGNTTVHRTYPTETVPFIKKLKIEMPELGVYAAFDPYRSNIRYELDYLKAKEDAGAAGFMSQPFFDLRLLEIYAEYLEGKNVFWGISPVLSASNRNYWESRNRAVFPRSFRPDLFWNVDFGRRVLGFCEAGGFNLYLIPIKIDLGPYLEGIFG
ncbi:MAG: methylenetetrahydrofolate reductase [Treponema sp.]|jgi:methylenetetrahydrofolate reductase (NADPH)|nr:methylenetetrahydrofolate reductase [Treponema sp.]